MNVHSLIEIEANSNYSAIFAKFQKGICRVSCLTYEHIASDYFQTRYYRNCLLSDKNIKDPFTYLISDHRRKLI